jgi:hypothetical protein
MNANNSDVKIVYEPIDESKIEVLDIVRVEYIGVELSVEDRQKLETLARQFGYCE